MAEISRHDHDSAADRPDGGPHHHRSPDTSSGRLVLAAAIVLILVVVAGGTVWWMYTRDPVAAGPTPAASRPSTGKCPAPALRVVAVPEIAPVVRDAATTIGPPRGGCAPVEVVAEEPFATLSG